MLEKKAIVDISFTSSRSTAFVAMNTLTYHFTGALLPTSG